MEQIETTANEAPVEHVTPAREDRKTPKKSKKIDPRAATLYIVRIALLTAMSIALMYLSFPLIPGLPVKMEFADIPVAVGAITMGPWNGVLILALKCLLYSPQSLANTGGIGVLSNFICGAPFALAAGYIFKRKKTAPVLVAALLAGMAATLVVSYFSNRFLIIPLYMRFMGISSLKGIGLGSSGGLFVAAAWLLVPTVIRFATIVALAFPLSVVLMKYVFKDKAFKVRDR